MFCADTQGSGSATNRGKEPCKESWQNTQRSMPVERMRSGPRCSAERRRGRCRSYGFDAAARSIARVARVHRNKVQAKNSTPCAVTVPKSWNPEGLATFTSVPTTKQTTQSHQDK